MQRIIVVGTTGSGKSTVASKLSKQLGHPHTQLDALFWRPNWGESPDSEFFEKIKKAVDQPTWVLDGNYHHTNQLTWIHADTVIWIDFPFWLTFYQNLTRSQKRSVSRKEIWEGTGNKESLLRLFSSDSILLWLLKSTPVELCLLF